MNNIFNNRGLSYDAFKSKSANGNVVSNYWSSTEKNTTIAYQVHMNGGYVHLHGNLTYTKAKGQSGSGTFGVRSVLVF